MSVSNFRANVRMGVILSSLLAGSVVSVMGAYQQGKFEEPKIKGIEESVKDVPLTSKNNISYDLIISNYFGGKQ